MKYCIRLILCLLPYTFLSAEIQPSPQGIDVVIPCIAKDLDVLELCIHYARKHVKGLRKIIVVSPERLTDAADWFDEKDYFFSKESVAKEIGAGFHAMEDFPFVGWCYQQLLKLYAPFAIPDISNNVLIIDADTFLLSDYIPVDQNDISYFRVFAFGRIFKSYVFHSFRMHPSIKVRPTDPNPVVNYSIFQKDKLEKLFALVEEHHNKPFWKAFLHTLDMGAFNGPLFVGGSEYLLYFYYMRIHHPNKCQFRQSKIHNHTFSIAEAANIEQLGYDSLSAHHYHRKKGGQ